MSGLKCSGTGNIFEIFTLVLALVSSVSPVGYNQGFFNGSAYVRLHTPLSLTGHIGLSFRTCVGGQLFNQRTNENSFLLEVSAEGLLFSTKVGHKQYDSKLSAGLLDNVWHYVNLQYRLGNLTLSVAGHQQVVANSSYNLEVLNQNLSSDTSVPIIGQGFIGCLLQGPSIVFNTSEIVDRDVQWGTCPLSNGSCTKMDYCNHEPCMRHGTCVSRPDSYECHCAPRYSGKNCESDNGPPCDRRPCQNGGRCSETEIGDYICTCISGYTGRHCETALSTHPCVNNPCLYNGTCQALDNGEYECNCLPGFTGMDCEVNIDDCASNPCQNGGMCIDGNNNFTCDCTRTGYTGHYCDVNIDECQTGPCLNGGTCFDNYGGYTCQCIAGYGGQNCEMTLNECSSDPCYNQGTCENKKGRFECSCPVGFTGSRCETNINDCEGITCPPNSECADGIGTYQCLCKAGFTGTFPNCTSLNPCTSDLCYNGGTCTSFGDNYNCTCPFGYSGPYCERAALTERCHPSQCKNGGTCNGEVCTCLPNFTGSTCEAYVECADNPCVHASACQDTPDGYVCTCDSGWTGTDCNSEISACLSAPCHNGGACIDVGNTFYCKCLEGFSGKTCEINIDECVLNPCKNGGSCIDRVNDYNCDCTENFMGKNCELEYDICGFSPCQNNGTCLSTRNKRDYTCNCATGFEGPNCEINIDDCAKATCPKGRVCIDGVNSYTCRCLEGYTGEDCLADADPCSVNPCHNGTCHISPGIPENYTCACFNGFTGKNCEKVVNMCEASKNLCNNGICVDTNGTYQCFCRPGYSGDHCDLDFDECLSRPCLNNAECINKINSFSCVCTPGYTGSDCSIDIDECESNPCQEGATCVDGVAAFTCLCPEGLTGTQCEINIDDCASSPCQNDGICIDGLNSFTCNCSDTGFEGLHCENNIDDCVPDQCQNGAQCVDKVKDYECQCYPGYEGKNCEIDVNECDSSPCQHGGTCLERSNVSLYWMPGSTMNYSSLPLNFHQEFSYSIAAGYDCICVPGTAGDNCQIDINECDSNPCRFGGTCIDGLGSYTCSCDKGFEGDHCEIDIDECEKYKPCVRGTCQDGQADYLCICEPEYGGKNCSVKLIGCESKPCLNNGTCKPFLVNETQHEFNCSCPNGFHGNTCEATTTMSMAGDSYVLVNTSRDEGYDIQLRFKTTLPNGLLALGAGATFYILEMKEGQLNLQSSLLNRLNGITIGSDLNKGDWQKIFIAINSSHVVLAANEEQTIYPITNPNDGQPIVVGINEGQTINPVSSISETGSASHTSFPTTYVGGTVKTYQRVIQNSSKFIGCIEDVVINSVRILPEIKRSFNFSLHNVETGCPRKEQCKSNPCQNGGNCTDKWRNFTCSCKRPYLGSTCQYEFTPATFGHEKINNSFVKVTVSESTRKSLNKDNAVDISMFVRTRQGKGDIFYIGTELGKLAPADETIIAAEMDGGELLVKIQFNSSLESHIVGGVKLADGNNHLIQVVRTMSAMAVRINGTEYFRKTISASPHLNVQVLYLGGLPSTIRYTRQVETPGAAATRERGLYTTSGTYYKGVIQDVQVNNLVVEFFPLNVTGLEVPRLLGNVSFDKTTVLEGVISDDTCMSNPCYNGGTCSITFNDFWCNCTLGYKGKTCQELEFCQIEKCPSGSTCKNLNDGYECIANVTFNGQNDSLTFMYKDLGNGSTAAALDEVDVTYRSRTGGTLLYISNGNSYFSISVIRDQVTVSWSLMDNLTPEIHRFHKEESNGSWTNLIIYMKDKDIYGKFTDSVTRMVPDQLLASNFPLESWQNLVRKGKIQLGSGEPFTAHMIPYDNSVTFATTTIDPGIYDFGSFFKGCIGEVRIGNLLLPFLSNSGSTFSNSTTRSRFSLDGPATKLDNKLGCVLCFESECQHGGYCLNASEVYDCECLPGYDGENCEIDIDECKGNQCEQNATCIDGIANYTCNCPVGYAGWLCDVEIDECMPDPCKNGGTCVDGIGLYECKCLEDFIGVNCEHKKVITCASLPCRMGSTCKDITDVMTGNNFTCECSPGYEGTYCNIPYCSDERNSCRNGGFCNVSGFVPFCQCIPGFRGLYCEENINDCILPDGSSPCLHNGVCNDGIDFYTCDCTDTGYEGTNCEIDIDECRTAKCGKGECFNREGSYTCKCEPMKCGLNCEYTDPCSVENPCQNGGTCSENCVTGEGKYLCDCPDGYGGQNCTEEPVSSANDAVDLAIIITPIVVFILVVVAIGLGVFVTMARKKRATRGTYSPSQQEYCNPRVEMDNVMKPPPEERLI